MDIALKVERPEFPASEVHDAVEYALRAETEQARLRRDYYQNACRTFESRHNLSSDKFLARFEAGELGDDAAYFNWYAAKRGLDLWERRYRILSGVSV
jgi:hypothetical protein